MHGTGLDHRGFGQHLRSSSDSTWMRLLPLWKYTTKHGRKWNSIDGSRFRRVVRRRSSSAPCRNPAESEPPKLPPHVESAAYEIVTFDFLSIPTIKEEPMTPVLAPVSNQNGEVLSRTNPPVEEPENPKPIEDPEDPEGPGHDENPEELPTSPE